MPRTDSESDSSLPGSPPSPAEPTVRCVGVPFPVVGIGASAGGVEAFRQMLQALPKDTGMAFVLVLHLPPDHDSMLTEILERVSPVPVRQVHDRMPIEPNRAYVLPAGSNIDIAQGELVLTPRALVPGYHYSLDHFLHSLAECQGEKAIGVILSGSAADGTIGIQEIKAAGGITFAQDDTAKYTSMPRSAIATGAVDFVLPPDEIGRELGRIASHPLLAGPPEAASPSELPDVTPVLDILRETAGVDFRQYKPNTLQRRIGRRIVLHKLEGIAQYVGMLRDNAAEAEALYQDILINVTSFFRNPEAFDVLKSDVFSILTENRSRHDPVRIWTLACSTGEEAYSLAMAFAEFTETLGRVIPLQIFATDLNSVSIEKARSGTYSKSAVQDVSPERLRRFFVQVDGHYRVAKPIRDCCVFARHNVLVDPPFSRIDLVSCRNMLIYMGSELQQKVIPVVHHALRESGFLWLGTSETIGSYRDLFDLKDTKYKIYVRKGVAARLSVTTGPYTPALPRTDAAARAADVSVATFMDAQKDADRILATRYAPASVLVNADLDILQYRGDTSPYLAPMPGRASLNLLKMLREGLTLGVRGAVQAAKADEMPSRQEDLRFAIDGKERRVNVEVIPMKSGVQRAELFMVIFEAPPAAPPPALNLQQQGDAAAAQEIMRMQQELQATREYLHSVIEQQEAANEELQSANEEVQSTNEELQSINEELETSKEEVQSSNEELATVNDELQARNTELAQSNNDLVNLLSSVQLAIVMLGPDLRIRRFTPMAEKLLSLIPADVGRPVGDIKLKFDMPDLEKLVAQVLDTMAPFEREVQDKDGHWHLLRIRPYRTLENKIDGAVIVLVDVDSLKSGEEMLRRQTELLDHAHEPIIMWELDGAINYWNNAAENAYGFTRQQAVGRTPDDLLRTSPSYASFSQKLHENAGWAGELIHTRRDGSKIAIESRMVLVNDTKGRRCVLEANRAISEPKDSNRILRRLADDLITADRRKDEFLAILSHELRNPLAPLRTMVPLLKSDGTGPHEKRRALDIMERQIGNMARLVDDLLDVSRITLSQIELRTDAVDIVAAASRVAEQLGMTTQARQQSVHLDLPETPLHVRGDVVRLEQIMGNLVENASKYSGPGADIRLSVRSESRPARVAGQRGADEIVVRVSDNGIGIEPDKLPHVFDLFMRAKPSLNDHYGGLGIGLTLVKRLAELHGGRVEARSEGTGKGSEFVVRLPRLEDAEAATQAKAEQPAAVRKRRRILVVDDNPDQVEATAMSLRLAEHEVAVAENGRRALEVAREFRPEIALVDIGMPDMDGYELARQLHKILDGRLRLIAVSGYGQADDRKRAHEAGFDDYLVKPASLQELERAIAQQSSG